jgi:hypothetical protein
MRHLLLPLLLLVGFNTVIAQSNPMYMAPAREKEETEEENKKFDASRLVFGGNLGVSFGDLTFVNISPQVGYMFSPTVTAGAGINYVHTGIKTRDLNGNELFKENYSYAGLNVFGRVFPTNFLFASLQPEVNYSWGNIRFANDIQPDIKAKGIFVPSLLVGAGLFLGSNGGRGGFMLSMQYDLAQDPRSPYGSAPFINMGYAF